MKCMVVKKNKIIVISFMLECVVVCVYFKFVILVVYLLKICRIVFLYLIYKFLFLKFKVIKDEKFNFFIFFMFC